MKIRQIPLIIGDFVTNRVNTLEGCQALDQTRKYISPQELWSETAKQQAPRAPRYIALAMYRLGCAPAGPSMKFRLAISGRALLLAPEFHERAVAAIYISRMRPLSVPRFTRAGKKSSEKGKKRFAELQ